MSATQTFMSMAHVIKSFQKYLASTRRLDPTVVLLQTEGVFDSRSRCDQRLHARRPIWILLCKRLASYEAGNAWRSSCRIRNLAPTCLWYACLAIYALRVGLRRGHVNRWPPTIRERWALAEDGASRELAAVGTPTPTPKVVLPRSESNVVPCIRTQGVGPTGGNGWTRCRAVDVPPMRAGTAGSETVDGMFCPNAHSLTLAMDMRRLRNALLVQEDRTIAAHTRTTLPTKLANVEGNVPLRSAGLDSNGAEDAAAVGRRAWLPPMLRRPTSFLKAPRVLEAVKALPSLVNDNARVAAAAKPLRPARRQPDWPRNILSTRSGGRMTPEVAKAPNCAGNLSQNGLS
eukprot:CAMPEP_0117561814 /NCGR_PEP_ID=MMETSP0784-20121206/54620_1 /TAXON_ID=39447 /ORGANISM="" /LENGTH=344 /DNA_ID=CAMNT_0005359335 /DNA_START=214 /DNA_END=1245 /DNA_ORIENTATION=-